MNNASRQGGLDIKFKILAYKDIKQRLVVQILTIVCLYQYPNDMSRELFLNETSPFCVFSSRIIEDDCFMRCMSPANADYTNCKIYKPILEIKYLPILRHS